MRQIIGAEILIPGMAGVATQAIEIPPGLGKKEVHAAFGRRQSHQRQPEMGAMESGYATVSIMTAAYILMCRGGDEAETTLVALKPASQSLDQLSLQLETVIINLLASPFSSDLTRKVLNCLTAHRKVSGACQRPELYNGLIRRLKTALSQKGKQMLWKEIEKANLDQSLLVDKT